MPLNCIIFSKHNAYRVYCNWKVITKEKRHLFNFIMSTVNTTWRHVTRWIKRQYLHAHVAMMCGSAVKIFSTCAPPRSNIKVGDNLIRIIQHRTNTIPWSKIKRRKCMIMCYSLFHILWLIFCEIKKKFWELKRERQKSFLRSINMFKCQMDQYFRIYYPFCNTPICHSVVIVSIYRNF